MSARPNLIFDVGMHNGEDTNFYLKKGFNVVALEANPELIARCKQRFAAEIAANRLHIVEGAIAPAGSGDRIVFYKNKNNSVWGTIMTDWAERNARKGAASENIEVNCIDMANIFLTYGIPYYLKIDVEGVDRLVLNTLKEFTDRPTYVSIESEKVDFAELEAELNLLCDLGYKHFQPVQQKRIPGSKIVTHDLQGRAIEYVFEKDASGPVGEDLRTPWLGYDECRREYLRIFRNYRVFGDNASIRKIRGGPLVIRCLERGFGIALPGWYDTHAKLD